MPALGAPDYVELHLRFGSGSTSSPTQCRRLLDETERLYEDALDKLFRERVGISLSEARALGLAAALPGAGMGPGLPVRAAWFPRSKGRSPGSASSSTPQPNVELDVEQREKKSPRAFCAPIEVPGRVVLVIQPMGGPDDWRALFHEAGHTEHFANTSADLPVEEPADGRQRGHGRLGVPVRAPRQRPAWLTRRLDFPRSARVLGGRRRAAPVLRAPLLREAALRARAVQGGRSEPMKLALRRAARGRAQDRAEPDGLARRRGSGLLRDASTCAPGRSRRRCRSTCASASAATGSRRATPGRCSASCGRSARSPTADELLDDVTGAEIDMASVTEQVRERLR